jgi:hypothetical protein
MKILKSIVYNLIRWAKPLAIQRLNEDKEAFIKQVKKEVKPFVTKALKEAKVKKAEANKIANDVVNKVEESLLK